jgi:hypothetical protein
MSKRPTARPPPRVYSWHIYRLRHTPAQSLGIVEAADEDEAIRKAIEQSHVEPAQRDRLIARRQA